MHFCINKRKFSTIARFIQMRYKYVMANKYFTKDQFDKLTKDETIEVALTFQNNVIELQRSVDELTERIRLMNQHTYGRKTEQASLLYKQEQLDLAFNDTEVTYDETAVPEEEPVIEKVIKKRPKGKREDDLKKITNKKDVYIELTDEQLDEKFGKGNWKRLPYQIITKLEHIPACFEAVTYYIGVYAAKDNETIERAEKPAELWENSIVTPTLLASIMMAKFVNAVPLYRQEAMYKANDVEISRRTMASWIIRAYDRYLQYFYEAMKAHLMKQSILHADETPFTVNKDGRSAGSKSYMWVYYGGEETDSEKIVLYDYCHTRGTENAKKFLKDFKGTLITDGYQVYHKLEKDDPERFTVAGCWTHAKRKFTDVTKSAKDKSTKEYTFAYQAEMRIRKIYHEDNKLTDLSPEERCKERQTKIKPLVDEFFEWIRPKADSLPSESGTAKAIRYALNQEKFLRAFLADGRIPLDNNAAERKIRNFTIGRKNWVMVDTKSGAEASAVMYSIVETAKANNLKVYEYLTYVLTELSKSIEYPNTEVPERLLPWSDELPENVRKSK